MFSATPVRNRLLLSVASNYLGRTLSVVVSFLMTPFLLRHLGAVEFGLWTLIASVVDYGSVFEFGIAAAVTKYIAEHRSRLNTSAANVVITTALCLYSFLGTLVFLLTVAFSTVLSQVFNVPPGLERIAVTILIIMGLSMGIQIAGSLTSAVLQGLQRYDLINVSNVTGGSISAILTIFVLIHGYGLVALAAVNTAVAVAMQVGRILMIRRIAPDLACLSDGVSRETMWQIASFTAPLFVEKVAWQIEMKTDRVIIGASLPISAVGAYGIAQALANAGRMLTEQFVNVLLPFASELHATNEPKRLLALYTASTRITLAISTATGVVMSVLAAPLLAAWLGAAYSQYAPIVVILIIANIVHLSQWPAGSILQAMARHRLLGAFALGSAIPNLCASIILVRTLGLTGVALGTLIPTVVIYAGVMMPYSMRVIGASSRVIIHECVAPALIPAIVTAGVAYVLREALAPSSLIGIGAIAFIGAAVYGIIYFLFGAGQIEKETCRNVVSAVLRRIRAALVLH